MPKTLEQLKTELMAASDKETHHNAKVEKAMASSGAKGKFGDYGTLIAAVTKLPANPLGKKLLGLAKDANAAYIVVQSNADGFTQRYERLPAVLQDIVDGLTAGGASFGAAHAKDVADALAYAQVLLADAKSWKPGVIECRGYMNEYREAIKAKLKIQKEIDALVAADPKLAKTEHGNVATQNRFNRYSRIGRFGRVAPGAPPDMASASPAWGGRFGFFYGPGALDGAKTAADVVQKLALQYEYFWDSKAKAYKDVTGIEFEVSVSFDKAHGVVSPPDSPAGWAKLLGRLQDTNHDPGQEASGGGGAERVVRGPILESVRVVSLKHYPGVASANDAHIQAGLDKKVKDNNTAKDAKAKADAERLGDRNFGKLALEAKAIEMKVSRAEKAFKDLEAKAADPNTTVTHKQLQDAKWAWENAVKELDDLFYKANGRHDPVLQKQLTAIELTNVDKALKKASSNEEKEFLEKQKAKLLKDRDLKTAKDGGGKAHGDVLIQAHGAQEVVTKANEVQGFEEYSAYVTTEDLKQFSGPHAEAKRTVSVSGTQLTYGVKLDQKAPAKGADKTAVHPVEVRIEAGGVASVLANAKAARAEAVGHTGKAGHDAARRLPASAGYQPFPNIIGNLVEKSVGRLFGRTAGMVHNADKNLAKPLPAAASAHPVSAGAALKAAGADPLSGVKAKPRGELMATDIASLRQMRSVETKLHGHFDRLMVTTEQARPLISPQAANLQAAVARLDAQLASLKGARGEKLAAGARDVGLTLGEMAAIARKMGYQSAGTVKSIQKLVDQRREQLARLASGLSPEGKATQDDHARLDSLHKQVPGLDRVLSDKKKQQEAKDAKRGGSWGGSAKGGLGGALKGKGKGGRRLSQSALERVGDSVKRGDKTSLVDAVAPGAVNLFRAMTTKATALFDALRKGGHKPRFFLGGLLKKAKDLGSSALHKVTQGASAVTSLAKAVAAPVTHSLAAAVSSTVAKATSIAKAVAAAPMNAVKKTAAALKSTVTNAAHAVGNAAHKAWDSTKHAVSGVAQHVTAAAKATGNVFTNAWHKATGVVGAVAGKVKSGLSSAAHWVGDKAKKTGAALLHAAKHVGAKAWEGAKHLGEGALKAAKWAGNAYLNYTPMGKLLKYGWDKVGKAAWDKTKSFAKVAWDATKKVGKAAGHFLKSPAGQLLVTGLSMAASFIPGGMLVKAGIGAVMGGIEAYANGGDWKSVLAGAAAGGLEGALPFLKVGGLGKALIGGAKGALGAAVNGDFSLKGMAKGALGGAFDAAGGKLLKKFGVGGKALIGAGKGVLDTALSGDLSLKGLAKGALGGAWDTAGGALMDKIGKGKGLKALTHFMEGKGNHKGVLGKLQQITQKGAIQKLYQTGKKFAPKVVKGAVWLWDKAGKAHNVLEKVQAGGEHLQKGLSSIHDLAEWGAGKLGEDSKLGGLLKKVGGASEWANDKLGTGLEYVKKVDDVVTTAHDYMGKGFEFLGIDPNKEVAKMRALQKRQRKKGDVKQDIFDRIDNGLHGVNEKFQKKTAASRKKSAERKANLLKKATELQDKFANSKFGSKIIKGGEKLVKAGVWAHGQLTALNETMSKIVESGETIRNGLRNAVLATEDVDEKTLGGSLAWIHKTAEEWEGKVGGGLDFVKKIQGYTGQGQDLLGKGLGKVGVGEEELEASGKKAKVYYGLEKGEEGKKRVSGKPWEEGKEEEGEEVVAPWVQWSDKAKEKAGKAIDSQKAKHPKVTKTLEHLDKWREKAKKGAEFVSKHGHELVEDEDHKKTLGKVDAASRLLLGAKAGDTDEAWEEYKKRHEKGGGEGEGAHTKAPEQTHLEHESEEHEHEEHAGHGPKKSKKKKAHKPEAHHGGGQVHKHLEEGLGKKLEEKAGHHAKEVEQTESETDQHLEHVAGKEEKQQTHAPTPQPHAEPPHAEEHEAKEQEHEQEVPQHGLAGTVDHDGVAGGTAKEEVHAALPMIAAAQEAHAADPANDIVFQRARFYLDQFDQRVTADLPRLQLLAATDPEGAEVVFQALMREGRMPEAEIERLGNVVGADPFLSQGLGSLAQRLAAIRARIQPPSGAKDPEKKDEEGKKDPEAEAKPEAPEQEHVEKPEGGEPKHTETPGQAVPGADGGDVAYLGEIHEDTWIGSGAAARPIADGLSTNFHFEDKDGMKATVGGELAKLGGALMGLGESVKGAAGDVKGITDEVKGAAGAFKGMAGEVGELVGHKDNAFTKGADKVTSFADWVKKGAGAVGKQGGVIEKYGKQAHKFGTTWDKKGFFSAAGQLFKKANNGKEDSGPAPIVDAGAYADAPQRLDYGVMGSMERFIGSRFADVKIHTGKGAELITKRFDAEAVTIREHIFFAPGRYNPHSSDGRRLLAHELTHVAQRGRPNLDTRTAEEEAHKAEALYGEPGMEMLDLRQPQPDFQVNMAGAEKHQGVRTAKKERSISGASGSHDEGLQGEELLDRVGERVYELLVEDLEKDFDAR